jgi:hypothetical protein
MAHDARGTGHRSPRAVNTIAIAKRRARSTTERPRAAQPQAKELTPMPANKDVDPTKGLSLDPDEFLEQQRRREKALTMQDAIRPGRTSPIAVRFDQFTLQRLKALAALRNTGYQTLLKEFVVERLYEEEKRAGIIDR